MPSLIFIIAKKEKIPEVFKVLSRTNPDVKTLSLKIYCFLLQNNFHLKKKKIQNVILLFALITSVSETFLSAEDEKI